MKKSAFFLVIFLTLSLCQAQVPGQYSVELQKILTQFQGTTGSPGISAAVYIKGAGIWQGASGFSHPGVPMDTTMLLGIASNTKLFTSVLCLKLQEDKILSLDDSLHKWIPSFRYVDSNITLRQLLRHQSGIDDYLNSQSLVYKIFTDPSKTWTPEEILAEIGPPHFKAGAKVEYSNTNYILAGMIIEAATGRKYSELIRDTILDPLGLKNTYLEGFENAPGVLAHPWMNGQDYSYASRKGVGTVGWAAGCIVSKPSDIVRWYDRIFNNHFLTDESMAQLTDFVTWYQGSADMGLGLVRYTYYPKVFWGHGGRTLGFVSACLFDVDTKHIVSVMMNDYNGDPEPVALALIYKINELTESSVKSGNEEDELVNIYPNPATDYIDITIPESISQNVILSEAKNPVVKVYDVMGVCVLEHPAVSRHPSTRGELISLDVSGLSPGVYFVRVGSEVLRFVKL